MSYKLLIDQEAFDDLEKSISYYKEVSEKLANKFKKAIKKELNTIEKQPLIYQKRYREVRITFTKNFPYGIHYLVGKNKVEVIRILHTKMFYKE